MGSIYPQELKDLDTTLVGARACFLAWMESSISDKVFSYRMSDYMEQLQKEMASLKYRYTREAKAILDVGGGDGC